MDADNKQRSLPNNQDDFEDIVLLDISEDEPGSENEEEDNSTERVLTLQKERGKKDRKNKYLIR